MVNMLFLTVFLMIIERFVSRSDTKSKKVSPTKTLLFQQENLKNIPPPNTISMKTGINHAKTKDIDLKVDDDSKIVLKEALGSNKAFDIEKSKVTWQ
jgi:hypothetical protein